jgi:hypothetical protein
MIAGNQRRRRRVLCFQSTLLSQADIRTEDLVRARDPTALRVPKEITEFVKTQIGRSLKARCIHWLRIFFADPQGFGQTAEVLLDNELWDEAQEAVGSLTWERSNDYYSVRRFLVLQSSQGHLPK